MKQAELGMEDEDAECRIRTVISRNSALKASRKTKEAG